VLDDVMKVEWNLMVNEVDVMWQQMHRTQLKNKAKKDAKEGLNPFKVTADSQNNMLRRVPYYTGPHEYEYPDIEEFAKSGPLRTPKSSWTLRVRERERETLEPMPPPSAPLALTMTTTSPGSTALAAPHSTCTHCGTSFASPDDPFPSRLAAPSPPQPPAQLAWQATQPMSQSMPHEEPSGDGTPAAEHGEGAAESPGAGTGTPFRLQV
jgi:hypothetical protein